MEKDRLWANGEEKLVELLYQNKRAAEEDGASCCRVSAASSSLSITVAMV